MEYKIIELFAGIGGMSKAFQDIGGRVVWANEKDKYVGNIYKLNT